MSEITNAFLEQCVAKRQSVEDRITADPNSPLWRMLESLSAVAKELLAARDELEHLRSALGTAMWRNGTCVECGRTRHVAGVDCALFYVDPKESKRAILPEPAVDRWAGTARMNRYLVVRHLREEAGKCEVAAIGEPRRGAVVVGAHHASLLRLAADALDEIGSR